MTLKPSLDFGELGIVRYAAKVASILAVFIPKQLPRENGTNRLIEWNVEESCALPIVTRLKRSFVSAAKAHSLRLLISQRHKIIERDRWIHQVA